MIEPRLIKPVDDSVVVEVTTGASRPEDYDCQLERTRGFLRAKFDQKYMKVSHELENAKLKIENIDEEREEAISVAKAPR